MRNELLGVLSPFKNNLVKVTDYQQKVIVFFEDNADDTDMNLDKT